ncbi:MAG: hypothetical protein PHD54_02375 [Desulfuromonadaceae bacterium]|nr:hypothetical protein [Desulfuromonadaceae bacterium]
MKSYLKKYCNSIAVILAVVCLAGAFSSSKINFNSTGDREGFFLLEGEAGYWFELTDDLFPEEAPRLIYGTPLTWFKRVVSATQCIAGSDSCINFDWNESTGRGFIKNLYPDGRKLLICLGRFQGHKGIAAKGLFVGGGLPPGDPDYNINNADQTGMAFFNGNRYYHIWCNVNEGMASDLDNTPISHPTEWEFIESKVLENSGKNLTLSSSHRALINGTPYEIDKYLFYNAGDSYFTLVTEITNRGDKPARFIYLYGDEPFLGNYGSSKGNVGWLNGGLVNTESHFDTWTNTFAGMFDYGNPLAGEKHGEYTGVANFIEWDRESRPQVGYFANREGGTGFGPNNPLANPDNRFIGLEWARELEPAESFSFTLAIGMAGSNPVSQFPEKPFTNLN